MASSSRAKERSPQELFNLLRQYEEESASLRKKLNRGERSVSEQTRLQNRLDALQTQLLPDVRRQLDAFRAAKSQKEQTQ